MNIFKVVKIIMKQLTKQEILEQLLGLNSAELQEIQDTASFLNKQMYSKDKSDLEDKEEFKITGLDSERFSDELFCTKCGCKGHIIKAGKRKSGLQRYRCKDCGKYFTSYNDTILKGTHKNIETWKKFMDCYNRGCILKECARECEIHINTAFIWRHKISNALREKEQIKWNHRSRRNICTNFIKRES